MRVLLFVGYNYYLRKKTVLLKRCDFKIFNKTVFQALFNHNVNRRPKMPLLVQLKI